MNIDIFRNYQNLKEVKSLHIIKRDINYLTTGIRSKRRIYLCTFQVHD